MESRITCTSKRRRKAGFTLAEMLIVAGLSGLIVAVFLSVLLFTTRGILCITDSMTLSSESRYAIDRMSQKIRQATAVEKFSPSSITVTFDGKPLTYLYRSNNQTLVEIRSGTTNVLLENCENLNFVLYKRNPVTNSFNQFPAETLTSEAKLVQVNWQCRTTRLGRQSGMGEMISSKIVLRSK
jgi:Tfp pilus assembly protein PilW